MPRRNSDASTSDLLTILRALGAVDRSGYRDQIQFDAVASLDPSTKAIDPELAPRLAIAKKKVELKASLPTALAQPSNAPFDWLSSALRCLRVDQQASTTTASPHIQRKNGWSVRRQVSFDASSIVPVVDNRAVRSAQWDLYRSIGFECKTR